MSLRHSPPSGEGREHRRMGLEAVEFVMDIEEEFKISITDDDVMYFRTLGHVHDYLLEKCAGRKPPGCPTRAAFYRLRRALNGVLGAERRAVRPSTSLLTLLGQQPRTQAGRPE